MTKTKTLNLLALIGLIATSTIAISFPVRDHRTPITGVVAALTGTQRTLTPAEMYAKYKSNQRAAKHNRRVKGKDFGNNSSTRLSPRDRRSHRGPKYTKDMRHFKGDKR